MPRILVVLVLVLTSMLAVQGVTGTPASAVSPATHSLTVAGTGVGMYPDYDPAVRRYAATTTADTGGTITVAAATSDPTGTVLVDGRPLSGGQVTLKGLSAGDEVSVIFVDSAGREADSVFVLPADFPALTATINGPGITPGLVGLTLSQWAFNGWPQFDTVVDENGVPAWVRSSTSGGLDLKLQPNGHYSESRGPGAAGQMSGSVQIVEMNDRFRPIARYHTMGTLTDTDGHDSILEKNGSRVLLAYQPNPDTGKTDAVIQEVDAQGKVTFQWDSSKLVGETVNDPTKPDYAHINSVAIVDGGENFLASFRHLSAVVKIARLAHGPYQPGDIVWKLGGRDSTFSFVNDPYDGPCAQHAASQLSNGDIMVFDDGSASGFGSFCVDQSDPTGPTHERVQSRVAVWHLDEATHTATLVWSYEPPGWFSWFMGSAERLASGNTLIGWAADTHALATEVAPDGTPVWQLVAAPSSDSRTYLSYRAAKFAVPDTQPPSVRVTTPARGATYAWKQQVTTDFSCTDKGGSTLQTCGDQPPGAPLDTSVPGSHTFTVTAKDGAGNTTTITRHYTVTPPYRPDASILRLDGSWRGEDVYGSARQQTVTRVLGKGGRARVPARLQDDGSRADACLVQGSGGTRRFEVSYWYAGADVTRAVEAGTWRSPRTTPGRVQRMTIRVRATRLARHGDQRTFVLRCTSVHDSARQDAVAVLVRRR